MAEFLGYQLNVLKTFGVSTDMAECEKSTRTPAKSCFMQPEQFILSRLPAGSGGTPRKSAISVPHSRIRAVRETRNQ